MPAKNRKPTTRHSYFKRNGLLIVFLSLTVLTLTGQAITGWCDHNEFLKNKGVAEINFIHYLGSGHFIQATFENWESEFLQMGLFVLLTVSLYQQGSSESKSLDKEEAVDREPKLCARAPWPVKRGGWILKLYENSLSISLLLLFIFSFVAHFYGSLRYHNLEQKLEHKPTVDAGEYIVTSRFWFESFQNWQSEFLSVAAIVFLSIYLRQKGSAQSKPVDMPHHETD